MSKHKLWIPRHLLAETGSQVYAGCYIEGAVDFIFGQTANIWVTNSVIGVVAGGRCITADGRPSSSSTGYFAFNDCIIEASSGAPVSSGFVYLGVDRVCTCLLPGM